MQLLNITKKIKNSLKSSIFWARFLGYVIPLTFFFYILYMNYLPFGYNKTFILNVGAENDTRVGEFYLEPSPDLSDRKTDEDGNPYRELNGTANLVFNTKIILKNAEINLELGSKNISIIPPYLNFDINSVNWDYNWNFTKNIPKELKTKNNKVFYLDKEIYFDGSSSLDFASSSNIFENKPFTIYAEWIPIDDKNDSQQIIGHYNWELFQDKKQVRFNVGRMNNEDGHFYSVSYKIEDLTNFFNKKHTVLAIYNPSNINGYIELFVDDKFIERKYLGPDKIFADYNKNKNISIGKSEHGSANFFKGSIVNIKILEKNIFQKKYKDINNFIISNNSSKVVIPIITQEITTLSTFKINVIQK